MTDLTLTASFLVSDTFIFTVVQASLLMLVVVARVFDMNMPHGKNHQKLSHFVLAYTVLSASVIQAVSASDVAGGFTLAVIIVDLWAIFYLCFYSMWFRGHIEDIIRSVQKRA